MNIKKYISELKRRNVFKAAVAYLIVAWLIIQVASIFLPTFNAPIYILQTILFLVTLGFPICLIFAWIYEMTPQGIKKTKSIRQEKSILAKTGNRLNKLIIIVLSVAILFLLFNQFGNKSNDKILKEESVKTNKKKGNSMDFIAVLPFHNSKPDPETDYLGFALANQIISDLIFFKNLVVRPSSSIRKYEKQIVDSKTVGSELQVSFVLNGNYLVESEKIRLNIELIDISTNKIIWNEEIQVSYKSAFELQDIVAKKVITGMNIQFSEIEINKIGKNVPTDPLAYEYYLKGLSYPFTKKGDALAISMFENAIGLDSTYALSYLELGSRISHMVSYGYKKPEEIHHAEKLFFKALSLDKELIMVYSKLSSLYTETGRIEEALLVSRKMLKINPNSTDAHFSLGYIYRYAGMQMKSIEEMEKAAVIDPSNKYSSNLSLSYFNVGEFDKAHKSLDISKNNIWSIGMNGLIYFEEGKKELAKEYFNNVISIEPDGFWGLISKFYLAYLDGDYKECSRILDLSEQANKSDAEPMYYNAVEYALIGDKEGCIRNLNKAIEGGYFNYPIIKNNSVFEFIHKDPEFQKILEQAKVKHEAFKKKFFS